MSALYVSQFQEFSWNILFGCICHLRSACNLNLRKNLVELYAMSNPCNLDKTKSSSFRDLIWNHYRQSLWASTVDKKTLERKIHFSFILVTFLKPNSRLHNNKHIYKRKINLRCLQKVPTNPALQPCWHKPLMWLHTVCLQLPHTSPQPCP